MPDIFYILLRRLRTPIITLILIYAVSILGFTLIPDEKGETVSFFHAFYFVSYTASTIGFGELSDFSNAQRLWAMVVIYMTVIGWLYSIGAMLAILQDPAFQKLRREYVFQRAVKDLRTPFYLISGYGDTGSILVRALADVGIKSVVVDRAEERINELELSDHLRRPLGLVGDASIPAVLQMAGIQSSYCVGVIALTDNDQTNLMIALSAELLNPGVRVLARADYQESVANIRSFGRNEVINPFETFAGRLALALHSPGIYTLYTWMTGIPHEALQEPLSPRCGHWVICGYGRFGKALHRKLEAANISVQVVDPNPDISGAPEGAITGSGTEAATLLEAGLKRAAGIVAGTDNDANNLSILMTAREQKKNLFMVARQNQRDNAIIFDNAGFDLVMKRGDVVAHNLFALLRTPLISGFLDAIHDYDNEWANLLVSRILGVVGEEVPYLWELKISKARTPALYRNCLKHAVTLRDILRNPRDRHEQLPIIPLLLKRDGQSVILPEEDTVLEVSDRLLMCADYAISREMEWSTQNENVLHYLLTGRETSGGGLWHALLYEGHGINSVEQLAGMSKDKKQKK